jgi:hypothetical protein
VLTGESIGIEWSADRATSVEIHGVGTFAASGSTTIEARAGRWQFHLTAHNAFGADQVMTKAVHVVKPPEISVIPVPEFARIEIRSSMPTPPAPTISLQRLAPVDQVVEQLDDLRHVQLPQVRLDVPMPHLPSLTSALPVEMPSLRAPGPLLGGAVPLRALDRMKFLIRRSSSATQTDEQQDTQ